MTDLDSRDYDISEIEKDPRFEICKREMIMCFVVWFLFAITTISVTYTLGRGPVNEYKYIFGLPSWIIALISITIVLFFIVTYLVLNVFKDFSLDDEKSVMKEGGRN